MKRIPLTYRGTSDTYALVDDEDYEVACSFVWNLFHKSGAKTSYATRCVWVEGRVRTIYLHRLLLGVTDPHVEVDHVNRDGLDNRRSNLRVCSRSQNRYNITKRAHCKSRFKGVTLTQGERHPWRARVRCSGKVVFDARFATEVDAAMAYDAVAQRWHREFACVNFPEMG